MVNLCSIKKRLEKNVCKLCKVFKALSADPGVLKMSVCILCNTLKVNSKNYIKITVISKPQCAGGLTAHALHAELGRVISTVIHLGDAVILYIDFQLDGIQSNLTKEPLGMYGRL